jgi:pilus assembly protein Flp/PilA
MDLRAIGAIQRNSYTILCIYKTVYPSIYSEAIMFKASPRGQGLVEYAFIIILVAILVIVMLALFGSGVGNMFSNVISNF